MSLNPDIFVSVVMILYNHKRFLKEAIDAVLTQTHSNLELIIVDDGSTDGSYVLLQELSLKDKRIRVFHQENSGPSIALNFGITQAQGKYIATTASDDIFYPHKIERQLDIFHQNPTLSAVLTHVNFIDECSKNIDAPEQFRSIFNIHTRSRSILLLEFLVHGNCLNASSAMFPTHLFQQVGFFHPASIQLQDWDFYFRCLDFGNIEIIPAKLMAYRVRSDGGNLSSSLNSLRSENEGYFVLPNLLNSIYRNCDKIDILKYTKSWNPDISHAYLENTPKSFHIYLLCRAFTENSILQIVATQFLATKMAEESDWNAATAREFFHDMAVRNIGKHREYVSLMNEIDLIKNSATFIIVKKVLWLPKLIRRFFSYGITSNFIK